MAHLNLADRADADTLMLAPTLRDDQAEVGALMRSIGYSWTRGLEVDWSAVFADTGGRRTDLPPHAFQRQRYWLAHRRGAGDVGATGQVRVGHPLLAAALPLADGGGVVLTGRLALGTQPWLAEHQVRGTAVLPGTGFVELALRAAREVDCGDVRELIVEAPLVIPPTGGVRIQVRVGPADDAGDREMSVHSQPDHGSDGDTGWTRHASGLIGPRAADAGPDGTEWPP